MSGERDAQHLRWIGGVRAGTARKRDRDDASAQRARRQRTRIRVMRGMVNGSARRGGARMPPMRPHERHHAVLFVCLGNICRSPTAEAVFRAAAQRAGIASRLTIDSAGTGEWHVGNPPDWRAIAHGAKRGYDLSTLRARQISRDDFARFDWILAMDRAILGDLGALRPAGSAGHLGLFLDLAPQLGAARRPGSLRPRRGRVRDGARPRRGRERRAGRAPRGARRRGARRGALSASRRRRRVLARLDDLERLVGDRRACGGRTRRGRGASAVGRRLRARAWRVSTSSRPESAGSV